LFFLTILSFLEYKLLIPVLHKVVKKKHPDRAKDLYTFLKEVLYIIFKVEFYIETVFFLVVEFLFVNE